MLSPFFYDLITEEEPPAERRNRECNFHRGTMPVSGIMRRGSDISRKAWARVKEGKVKEGGGKKKERRRISLQEQGRRLVLAAKA